MLKTNGHKTVKVGMKVKYRGCWGHDAIEEVTIEGMELCENEGEKYGEPVDEVNVEDLHRCTLDLDNEHWAYGW